MQSAAHPPRLLLEQRSALPALPLLVVLSVAHSAVAGRPWRLGFVSLSLLVDRPWRSGFVPLSPLVDRPWRSGFVPLSLLLLRW